MELLTFLKKLESSKNLEKIKDEIESLLTSYAVTADKTLHFKLNGDEQTISKDYLVGELKQISGTKTLERTNYYIKRLIKSLSEEKTGKVNDLNLNRWKEYSDIITDSLWIIGKRDQSGAHKADYWGNFVPQIPNQFLKRYTKKGDWVLDPFVGSGTTLIECKRLGRNGLGLELNKQVAEMAKSNVGKEKKGDRVKIKILNDDSSTMNYKAQLKKLGTKSVQFILMHPPYWDIIKFSSKKNDLSNAQSLNEFVKMFVKVAEKTYSVLDKGRYCAVVIGDKYSSGEWIPLGFYVMQEMMKVGYKLKSTIVKNFDQTTAKRNQKDLWRFRALAGGFYIFKHEYIFLFQK
ncbi:MAG: RsmD family RNA methyltransferase [Ignavibacteria bacterium]|nr:RsmD family RNA methyltransferase [Ignavibacteria bacterium]